jgi:SHS family lactate transporter-like MFS transporter
VPPRIRGLLSGVLQQGYAAGNLLAGICFFFLFDRVGWRPLFFLGGLPALLALFVRFRVKESEVWERTKQESWSNLFRTILSHWKVFAFIVVLMTAFNFVSHGTQDMYPTFLKRDWSFTPQRIAMITAIANVGAITGGIVFGFYSDRVGRRRAIVSALVLAVVVIPLWAFSKTVPLLVVGGFTMQFMVQGAWGVIPAHINELAPDSVRGFLPGFAYQCGVAVAGTVAYIEAIFADRMTYATAMAFTAATVFILGAVAAWAGKEKRGIAFGEVAPLSME